MLLLHVLKLALHSAVIAFLSIRSATAVAAGQKVFRNRWFVKGGGSALVGKC